MQNPLVPQKLTRLSRFNWLCFFIRLENGVNSELLKNGNAAFWRSALRFLSFKVIKSTYGIEVNKIELVIVAKDKLYFVYPLGDVYFTP